MTYLPPFTIVSVVSANLTSVVSKMLLLNAPSFDTLLTGFVNARGAVGMNAAVPARREAIVNKENFILRDWRRGGGG